MMATLHGGYLFVKQHLVGGSPDGGAVTILCDSLVGVERVRRFLAEVLQAEVGAQKILNLYDEAHWKLVEELSLLGRNERLAKNLILYMIGNESERSSVEIIPDKDRVHIFASKKAFVSLDEDFERLYDVEYSQDCLDREAVNAIHTGGQNLKESIIARALFVRAYRSETKAYDIRDIFFENKFAVSPAR